MQYSTAQERLRDILADYLIPHEDFGWNCREKGEDSKAAIYILGGSRESLERKFSVASRLYHDRIGEKILLLREPGILDYSLGLKRNRSYDEWVIEELTRLGVRTQDIETKNISREFFGTLSEAKNIPGIVAGQGYPRLALVTASLHARRTWVSFRRHAEMQNLMLCMYYSDEEWDLRECVQEMVKLIAYKLFLV